MTLTMSAIPTDVASSNSALRRFLHGLPGVDQVGAQARAAALSTRSIKTDAKRWAIDTAISMIDLTTLEGQDTHGKVRALCAKGIRPDPSDASCPSVAAICVYPDLVPTAKEYLGESGVKVASVATSFPSGRAAMTVKLADVRDAVANGADEIDMVIDRGAFLEGHYLDVYDEIVQVKAACKDAHLKVILETGELATYDNVKRASWLAMIAGGDFIKTSTGKVESSRDAARHAGHAAGRPRLPRHDGPASRRQARRRHSHHERRDALPRTRERNGRRRLAQPRLVPPRRVEPAQRSPPATPEDGNRPLLRPRLRHDRLRART